MNDLRLYEVTLRGTKTVMLLNAADAAAYGDAAKALAVEVADSRAQAVAAKDSAAGQAGSGSDAKVRRPANKARTAEDK